MPPMPGITDSLRRQSYDSASATVCNSDTQAKEGIDAIPVHATLSAADDVA